MGSDQPSAPDFDLPPSEDDGPLWMRWMLQANGVKEYPGSANNPMIVGAAQFVGRCNPSLQDYCDSYKQDATPWCGLAVAWAFAKANVRPPEEFLSSSVWRSFGFDVKSPEYGCVVCLDGHVGLFHHQEGSTIYLAGGNQSDMVTITPFKESQIIACRWPAPEDYKTGYYPDDDRK